MREFKEFPCTVFNLSSTYRVKKVTLVKQYSSWTTVGVDSSGRSYYARDCHLSFGDAVRAGQRRLVQVFKRLDTSTASAKKSQASLEEQLEQYLLKVDAVKTKKASKK